MIVIIIIGASIQFFAIGMAIYYNVKMSKILKDAHKWTNNTPFYVKGSNEDWKKTISNG